MRHPLVLITSAILALCAGSAASAAEGPRWTLDLTPVKTDTVTANGVQGPGVYLYMIFKIKNDSGTEEVTPRLAIDVETDVPGRHYRGTFDPVVHKLVEKQMGRKIKRLSQSREALADGEEMEVLVVFGKVDPNVDLFHFVFDGLKDRVYVDRYDTWIEDNLRLLTYERKGDEFYRQYDVLKFMDQRWITRKEREKLVRKPDR